MYRDAAIVVSAFSVRWVSNSIQSCVLPTQCCKWTVNSRHPLEAKSFSIWTNNLILYFAYLCPILTYVYPIDVHLNHSNVDLCATFAICDRECMLLSRLQFRIKKTHTYCWKWVLALQCKKWIFKYTNASSTLFWWLGNTLTHGWTWCKTAIKAVVLVSDLESS